ncbi:MAG TPA: DUF3488 and transglutaminase-like domain-containing protein [Methylophilaceae bacterium]|nr:DUF3488 and transglutaminase-like domain-containing protein [Methylophilaceae bacterium]
MIKAQTFIKPGMPDLRWLLVSLAAVMALHVSHLAIWVSLFIAAFGVWRYLIEKNGWQLPKLVILMPLTLLAGLGIMLTYKGLFGRDASVALLAIMLSLKLMETKKPRDYILLVFAGYFLTITAFLFNQSLLVGAFILLPVFGLTSTLIGVSHPNGDLGWRFQAKLAGSLLAQGIPVMLALFFLFPRVPGPLWGVPQDAYKSMTGLSDSMQPGNISQLSLSSAIAFRVQFKDEMPKNNQLYWRGPVLWHYDGRSWTMRSQNQRVVKEALQVQGSATNYTVTLEPHNRNWLLMLDMPESSPADTLMSSDLQVLSRDPVRTRIRYVGSSFLNYSLAAELNPRDRELALQLNDDENPRTFSLAKQWVDTKKTPEQIVQTALTMYREQPFAYTLRPPLLSRLSPVDDFLFNTRRGFCEHYASSFVFLMRAAGVPARVVTGYQGGEVNLIGNYLIVRQNDAHAWAEVWLQGRGWVRIDPTAAVSPERVESGIEAALPENDVLPMMSRRDFPLLRKLYLNWDAVNNGWNQYVLGYNQQRQMDLLSRLAGTQISWQDLVVAMMVSVGSIGLILSYFLLRGTRIKIDPLQRLYAEFLRKLEKAGLKRYKHEGPVDFCQRATKRLPAKASEIKQLTETYTRLRYGKQLNPTTLESFKQLVNAFKT